MASENGTGKWCCNTALENSNGQQHWKMASGNGVRNGIRKQCQQTVMENGIRKTTLEKGIGKWHQKMLLENSVGKSIRKWHWKTASSAVLGKHQKMVS
jgi:hypothetical protein